MKFPPLTAAELTKEEYTGKDFDDELFIELRTPKMCEDLFQLLWRVSLVAKQKNGDARIDGAAAATHHQAFQGREPHGRVDAPAVSHGGK